MRKAKTKLWLKNRSLKPRKLNQPNLRLNQQNQLNPREMQTQVVKKKTLRKKQQSSKRKPRTPSLRRSCKRSKKSWARSS